MRKRQRSFCSLKSGIPFTGLPAKGKGGKYEYNHSFWSFAGRRGSFPDSLERQGAVQAEIITLGAIIKSLWVPDRKDDRKDVVLGQDSLEAYLNNQSCSAAVIAG